MSALLSFIFESYCLSCQAMFPELDAERSDAAERSGRAPETAARVAA